MELDHTCTFTGGEVAASEEAAPDKCLEHWRLRYLAQGDPSLALKVTHFGLQPGLESRMKLPKKKRLKRGFKFYNLDF